MMYDLNYVLDGFNRFIALAPIISNEDLDQMIDHLSNCIYEEDEQTLVDAAISYLRSQKEVESVKCIKDCHLDGTLSHSLCFTENTHYEVVYQNKEKMVLIDNQGERHTWGLEFMPEYFEVGD